MDQQAFPSRPGAVDEGPPENVWIYIGDMLGELAGLASANGAHALATTITLAALEAARTEARMSDED